MASLKTSEFDSPTFRIGIGGNYYVICDIKEELFSICDKINKSRNSVWFHPKYQHWFIRVKQPSTKVKLKQLFKGL